MKPSILAIASIFLVTLSITARAQRIDSMINVYGESYPQEKIHVHFDKSVYNPGETIWFKAYLFSGFLPSGISKNFYAELVDLSSGKILQRKVMPIFEASTAGTFDLPLSVSAPEVLFRAYTTWMMNFDTAFLYTRSIRIVSASAGATPSVAAPKLRFFPEGGDMVTGLESVVAFNATDADGYPVNVKGVIKNAKGVKVTDFKSVHDGMGKIQLEPAANTTYYAEWTDAKGSTQKTDLPAAKPNGANLQLLSTADKISFIVKRSLEAEPHLKKLYIIANMYRQVVYKATIDLSSNFMTSGVIPVSGLPTGMLEVTLFNANWQPLAERIIFVNQQDYLFSAKVTTIGKNVAKRAKNIITVEVPDTLRSNLSVAITDAAVGDNGEEDIVSRLLLTGDLRGYIHKPAYYFSSNEDSVQQHLDLVLLTHGWRRFNWEDLAAGKVPVIKYPRENYLALKGELLGLPASQIPSSTQLNVFMEAKDSSRQFFALPVDGKGKFGEDGMIFFDTVKLFYQFNKDQRLASRAVVSFDNGTLRAKPVVIADPAWRPPMLLDTAAINRSRYIAAESDRLRPEMDKKIKTLEAVTVRSRARSKSQQLDAKYASGLFAGGDAYTFDMTEDPFATGARDIFQFLQGRVPGLQVNSAGPSGATLTWRQATPTLYLDEMPVDASMLAGIPVTDIAYVKAFRPPFFGAPGGGAGGAIAIYTKKGNDGKPASNLPGGLEKNRLVGYAAPKEFYSPDYSSDFPLSELPDVRTTLYWAPYILLDRTNRKTTIQFYNNDISKKLKLVLEGVNEEGRLLHVERIME